MFCRYYRHSQNRKIRSLGWLNLRGIVFAWLQATSINICIYFYLSFKFYIFILFYLLIDYFGLYMLKDHQWITLSPCHLHCLYGE